LVGPRGHVVAFEPTPRTRRDLSSNIVDLGNVTIVPKAAWDGPTRLTLRDFGWQSSSFNSLMAPRLTKALPYQPIEVEAIAVDDWLNAHGLVPHFIKIDAESAEHRVLQGLARTIERHHPILSVEIGDFDLPGVPSSADLIRSLLAQGYDAWQYRCGRFELHRIGNRYAYDNLLFMPSRAS
jgi:FkbM family methyltransferase